MFKYLNNSSDVLVSEMRNFLSDLQFSASYLKLKVIWRLAFRFHAASKEKVVNFTVIPGNYVTV